MTEQIERLCNCTERMLIRLGWTGRIVCCTVFSTGRVIMRFVFSDDGDEEIEGWIGSDNV